MGPLLVPDCGQVSSLSPPAMSLSFSDTSMVATIMLYLGFSAPPFLVFLSYRFCRSTCRVAVSFCAAAAELSHFPPKGRFWVASTLFPNSTCAVLLGPFALS